GSDVANLSLLGFNPAENYTGRAPIEAAGAGIPMTVDDVAFRCNLVTIKDGRMADYSAGEISTPEAHCLIADLEKKLGRDGLHFHGGVSYRHLLIWKNGPAGLHTQPPHDIAEKQAADFLPSGERQDEIRRLMDVSREVFAHHPVNIERLKAGRSPATQIWLWGQGHSMALKSYQELYGLRGGVISAVDLIRGLGALAGLRTVRVPGATGFIDTNYAGKVSAAIEILQDEDFVFLHVEAPDECGHKGSLSLKVQAIEAFDQQVVGPVWNALEAAGQPYRLIICTDHRTPVKVRGHTSEPVPMAFVDGPIGATTREKPFDEFMAHISSAVLAYDWIRHLLKNS
ncbi:MAG: cofactor-independent phosphoglycerate mutase, partial [Lentisphaerota bacterium]